jgi:hypothetical protein
VSVDRDQVCYRFLDDGKPPLSADVETVAGVATEYGHQFKSGDRVVWDTAPYIEKVYPLAKRIEDRLRNDGKVYRRRIHRRNEAVRGKAKLLKCVECARRGVDKQARDWSWRHGTDPDDPMNYDPRCRKCHNVYDPTMGHHAPHTEEARAKMSASLRRRYGTDEREALASLNPDQPLPRVGANEHNSGKTHCPSDHEYTPANTYIAPDGSRHCIKCTRERTRKWREEQREKKLSEPPKVDTHGKGTKRTGQALENLRAGSRRRRERERAEREAREAGEAGQA